MDESEELGRGGLRLVEEALVFIFICFLNYCQISVSYSNAGVTSQSDFLWRD